MTLSSDPFPATAKMMMATMPIVVCAIDPDWGAPERSEVFPNQEGMTRSRPSEKKYRATLKSAST